MSSNRKLKVDKGPHFDKDSNEKHKKVTSKEGRKKSKEKAKEMENDNNEILKDLESHLSTALLTVCEQIVNIRNSTRKCFRKDPCLNVEECIQMYITMNGLSDVLEVPTDEQENQDFKDKYAKELKEFEEDCYYYFDKIDKEKVVRKISQNEINKILEIGKVQIKKG